MTRFGARLCEVGPVSIQYDLSSVGLRKYQAMGWNLAPYRRTCTIRERGFGNEARAVSNSLVQRRSVRGWNLRLTAMSR